MGALQDFALDQTYEGNDVALGIGTLTQADEGARKEQIQAMGRGSELPHPPGVRFQVRAKVKKHLN